MPKLALLVTTRTKPGQREVARRLWETHLRHRARANAAQEVYVFATDNDDPDLFHLFEVYGDAAVLAQNAQADWFADYMAEIAPYLDGPSTVRQMSPVWIKGHEATGAGRE